MTEPAPRTIPTLTAAAKDDPVLAERHGQFEYVRNKSREYAVYTAGLIGLIGLFVGGTFIAQPELSTLAGAIVVVVSVVLALLTLRQLSLGGAMKWIALVGPDGRSRLMSKTFVLRGDEQRAAEVYAKIAGNRDARSWPILNSARREGDIRVGVHLRRGSRELVLTLWMPDDESALAWPMLTPNAEHLDVWIKSIFRRIDVGDDHAIYLQNLNE